MAKHMIDVCLTFLKNAKLYSKIVIPFYIPTSDVWEFQLLHILINTGTCIFSILSILVRV